MRMSTPIKRLALPSAVNLTPIVLVNVIRRFPDNAISQIIDVLIDELDLRLGDPDSESETVEAGICDF